MKMIEPISAITSWVDYDYQGHVALYFSLKLIYEKQLAKESINDFSLQLEGEEDFSILEKNEFVSLHQVKAGKVTLYDNDKFSFIVEILENKATKGYFHVSDLGRVPNDFVLKTKNYISLLKKQLARPVIEKEKIPTGKTEDDYIVVDKVSGNYKKSDVYSLIKYQTKGSKNVLEVKKAVADINKELLIHENNIDKQLVSEKTKNPTIEEDNVFMEVYSERFNNATEIRNATYPIILRIISLAKPEFNVFADESYAKLVYDRLLLIMKERLNDVYIAKKKYGRCLISFIEIMRVIETDYHKQIETIEYQYYLALCAIRDEFDIYPQLNKCGSVCGECLTRLECNLFKQLNKLFERNEADRRNVIRNLLLQTPKTGKSYDLPSSDLIEDLLLNVLQEINIMQLSDKDTFIAVKDGKKTYRLSLDGSRRVEKFLNKLQDEISVSESKSLLYECDAIITDRLSEKNLMIDGDNISVLSPIELEDIAGISSSSIEDIKNDCNKPKIIELIDKAGALGVLK